MPFSWYYNRSRIYSLTVREGVADLHRRWVTSLSSPQVNTKISQLPIQDTQKNIQLRLWGCFQMIIVTNCQRLRVWEAEASTFPIHGKRLSLPGVSPRPSDQTDWATELLWATTRLLRPNCCSHKPLNGWDSSPMQGQKFFLPRNVWVFKDPPFQCIMKEWIELR